MLFWFGGGIEDREVGKESARNGGDTQEMQVQPLGQKYPLKEEHGNPLQYSCREKNPPDREVWQATLQSVSKCRT